VTSDEVGTGDLMRRMLTRSEGGADAAAEAVARAAATRWADLPAGPRGELDAYLEALMRRSGPPPDVVAVEDLILAAEAWWTARGASGAAVREGVRREYGRGRRPALREMDRRQKRQALAVGTLGELRRRLEWANGHGQGQDLASLLSQHHRPENRNG
jgi:hypothetical protein